jgi:hypothetical protein
MHAIVGIENLKFSSVGWRRRILQANAAARKLR